MSASSLRALDVKEGTSDLANHSADAEGPSAS